MNVARWMWNNSKGILVKLGIWVCIGGVLRTEAVLRVVFPWALPWMRKSMPFLYLCHLCKIALKKKISRKFLVWGYTYSLRYTIFPFIRLLQLSFDGKKMSVMWQSAPLNCWGPASADGGKTALKTSALWHLVSLGHDLSWSEEPFQGRQSLFLIRWVNILTCLT